MDLEDYRQVHIVGIGGIGTSGLARILSASGLRVSGSDISPGPMLNNLKAAGITIYPEHRAEHVTGRVELVITSSAIPEENPEILAARQAGIPVISYSQAVGQLMKTRFGLAVAGTHGKTGTSALIAFILAQAGENPGFIIGGEIPALGGNSNNGTGQYLVVEACEYRRNFLKLRPRVVVVTNVEEDHLDYYRDLTEIEEAFHDFLTLLPSEGFAILCRESGNLMEIAGAIKKTVYTYGFWNADYRAAEIRMQTDASECRVLFRDEELGRFTTRLPGRHNLLNSLAAFAVCHRLEIPTPVIAKAIAGFPGVKRRLELKGTCRNALVMDDYAHHPSEITATLAAVRQFYPKHRIFAVFQPHQYSRTRFFLDDFANAFDLADEILVPEIFFVRDSEESRLSVCAEHLVKRMTANGKRARFVASFEEAAAYLKRKLQKNDIVLTLGAGPVYQVADKLLQENKERD